MGHYEGAEETEEKKILTLKEKEDSEDAEKD